MTVLRGDLRPLVGLPDAAYGAAWEVVVDTADPLLAHTRRRPLGPGDRQRLLDRSMRVLRRSR